MNQRFTYSNPTRALSFPATASHVCVSELCPTSLNHPVQPLKGLRSPRAASVSYRAFAPVGAGTGHRVCAGTSDPRPTANYSLLTANSTHTFSAKEKDSETGLSYFGSRYYSSDLSIWLSVDPMASKYPSLSPYAYCANNPVKLVDPNGEEIVITETKDNDGNRVVNISFTAALVNKSSRVISPEKMETYKSSIEASLKEHYGGIYDDGTRVNVDVDLKVYDNDDFSYHFTDRHNIFILDQCTDNTKAGMAEEGGRTMELSLAVCDNINGKNKSNISNSFERTVAHEFGHFLNLAHDEVNNDNLMNQNTDGAIITAGQIRTALNNYRSNHLNQGYGFYTYQIRKKCRESLMKLPHW